MGIHCPADESTVRLWRRQIAVNLLQIEGVLQSLWQQQSRDTVADLIGFFTQILAKHWSWLVDNCHATIGLC